MICHLNIYSNRLTNSLVDFVLPLQQDKFMLCIDIVVDLFFPHRDHKTTCQLETL